MILEALFFALRNPILTNSQEWSFNQMRVA